MFRYGFNGSIDIRFGIGKYKISQEQFFPKKMVHSKKKRKNLQWLLIGFIIS